MIIPIMIYERINLNDSNIIDIIKSILSYLDFKNNILILIIKLNL